jgi:diguanylate cyclase (GGDEF)-like protein
LKIIAQRVEHYVRDEDTVCRNGGDEFLCLVMNPQEEENIEQIANSVLRIVVQPIAIADAELAITPSIGIAIYPHDGASGDQLIANADAAKYVAKKYASGVAFFRSPEARGMTE